MPLPSFYSRLGPEGQQIYRSSTGHTNTLAIPSELDYLLDEIQHPQQSTTPHKVLSYLAYYYPRLKNPANIQLLTESFLQCPLFESLKDSDAIIDCFRFILDKKYQVSEPTCPFYSFYGAICAAVSEIQPPWTTLPMIVGCLLTKDSRNRYDPYPEYSGAIKLLDDSLLSSLQSSLVRVSRTSCPPELQYIVLVCMSLINTSTVTQRAVLHYRPMLLLTLTDLIFNSPFGFNAATYQVSDNTVAIKRLNTLSQLYKQLIPNHPSRQVLYESLDASLSNMHSYSTALFNCMDRGPIPDGDWDLLKQNFFSVVVIFEGFAQFISQNGGAGLSAGIIETLYDLSFILDTIGTGGFESYNFVYHVATDCLFHEKPALCETLVSQWLQDKSASKLHLSKLLFSLNFIEKCLPVLNPEVRISRILPLVYTLVEHGPSQPITEAAHSVMLKYLTTLDDVPQLSQRQLESTLVEYLRLTLSQYPQKLSLNQSDLIIQTLGGATFPGTMTYSWNPNLSKQLRRSLYDECVNCPPVNIAEQNVAFRTRRAALTSTLIKLTPLFLLEDYIPWLDTIQRALISTAGPDTAPLLDVMWQSILSANKFYPQKGAVGFQWWYQQHPTISRI